MSGVQPGPPNAASGAPAGEEPAPRLSVEEKAAEIKTRQRDCRRCKAFRPDASGMAFGWCTAFEQYVKMYHPAGEFWSQCQFKILARTPVPEPEPESPQLPKAHPEPAPARTAVRPHWIPAPAAE